MNITKERVKRNAIFWISLLLLWIGSMAATYLLGRADRAVSQPASAPAPAPEVGIEPVRSSREVVFKALPPEVRSVETTPWVEEEIASDDALEVSLGDVSIPIPLLSTAELDRYLRSALESRDELYRELVFSVVLYQVTLENAPTLAATFESKGRKGSKTLCQFISAWARLDGPAAMAFARGPGRDQYSSDGLYRSVEAAVESWAEREPEACLDYLQNNGMVEGYLPNYLTGTAASDPGMFQSFVAGMEDPKLRRSAIFALAKGMRDRPGTLLDWAERVIRTDDPDPGFVKQLCHVVLMYDGEGALFPWVARNADSPWLSSNMFSAAASQGGKTDPLTALEWINRRASDPRITAKVFDNWMEGWRKTDKPGQIAWLKKNLDDPRITSSHFLEAVSAAAYSDPEAAADWVERTLGAKGVPVDAAGRVASRWVEKAPYKTWAWIGTLPAGMQKWPYSRAALYWPEDQLNEFVSQLSGAAGESRFDYARRELATRYIDVDPEFALSLPGTIVDPEVRESAQVKIAKKMMASNPDAVMAWLPGSGLSEAARDQILLKEPDK